MTLRNLLSEIDFDMEMVTEGTEISIRLIDLQGANLGGIESERFYSVESVIDRMDTYWYDYFIKELADEIGIDSSLSYKYIYNRAVKADGDSFAIKVLYCLLHPDEVLCTMDLNKSFIPLIKGYEWLVEAFDTQQLYVWADEILDYENTTESEKLLRMANGRYVPKIILLWESMITIDDFIEFYK